LPPPPKSGIIPEERLPSQEKAPKKMKDEQDE